MERPAKRKALVAIDLGAQSCRVSLLRFAAGAPETRVIYRFANSPYRSERGLLWDFERIFAGVIHGLRLCAGVAPEGIDSVGVDGWGVDYVRLAEDSRRIGDPFCHRDDRTTRAMEEVLARISRERLYELTGVQLLGLNTLFQLYADQLAGIEAKTAWVNLPEYVTHLLGGERVAEYTNATHTQLVSLGRREWCAEIFEAAGLVESAAPKIVPTGTIVGKIGGELRGLEAFRTTRLIVPACHDTSSAIAAIPAKGDDWAFISSGTWSLVGTRLPSPCVTNESRAMNFTNLGGVGGTICFLKNVNGMWLLQQCMEEWEREGQSWTIEELIRRCEGLGAPRVLIDVDDPQLLLPGDMLGKINAQLEAAGSSPLTTDENGIAEMANVIFHSLAKRYADVLACVTRITMKNLKRLFIVGGGSKNAFLNRLTAAYSGLEAIPGSSESATIGNFATQLAALNGDWNRERGVSIDAVAQYAEMLAEQFVCD